MQNSKLEQLSFWQLICFGVLTTPLAMGGLALVIYIPTFYAIDMGLGLTAVGAIFVFGRVFDVVTDPMIGHFSDQTRSKLGPRIPWMIIGAPFFCLSVWLLLSPPNDIGLFYLVLVGAAYFFFYTIVDVPYSSIGLEISKKVHERSLLASSKAVFQVIGAIAAASIPFALALTIPMSLDLIAKIIIVLVIMGLLVFLLFVPRIQRSVIAPRIGFIDGCKFVLKRRVFRYLVSSFVVIQSANALTAGLMVLYVTHVIEKPELIGAFLGLLFLSTALFLPLWVVLSKRFNKKTSWMISIIFCSLGLGFSFFLGAGDTIGFMILCIIIGAAFGCDAIMPTSILADIVSETERDGENRFGGTFLAIKNATSKLTFIVPMGLAFPMLEYVGFQKEQQNDPGQILTLIIFFAAIPIALRLSALWVIKATPITAAELTLHNG